MKFEIFPARQNRVKCRVLKHDAHFAPDLRRLSGDIKAGNSATAGCRPHNRAQHADGRRFPCAVGPQEAENFAPSDSKIDSPDGFDSAECF